MRYSNQLAGTVALVASLAAGAPTAPSPAAHTFSVTQVKVPSVKGFHTTGLGSYYKALTKYGANITSDVLTAVAAKQSGAVTATPESDDESYLCPVQIGTPAQTLQ